MVQKTKKNVLIVDDDVQWHDVFTRRFAACDLQDDCPYTFNVDTALSLANGVELLRQQARSEAKYDVVVFDLRMERDEAGIEGALALGLSLELREDLPVIIMFTGFQTYPTCIQAMRHGAWDYILKEDVGDRPAAQIVVDSAVERLRAIELRKILERQVSEWYPAHASQLIRDYAEQMVALWHDPEIHVAASARDAFEIADRLKAWRVGHHAWEKPLILRIPPAASEDHREA